MQVGKAGKKATARAQGDTENVLAQDDAQAASETERAADDQAGTPAPDPADPGGTPATPKTNFHVGLGAGLAVGVASNVSRAYISAKTVVKEAGSVVVSAIGKHVASIVAKAGVSAAKTAANKKKAAGQTVDETAPKNNDAGIAVDGSVAVGVSTNITEAYVEARAQEQDAGADIASLNSDGDITITAEHEGETISTATAEARGDIAVGLSVAVTAANDYSLAYLERDTTAGGDITVKASSNTLTSAQAKAAAGGSAPAAPAQKIDPATGEPEVDAEGNPVYEEQPSIIDESWNMAESNQTQTAPPAKAKKGKGAANKGSLPFTVSVGAALGVNVATSETQSYIGKPDEAAPDDKIQIDSGGEVSTQSLSNMDASAAANGSSVGSAIGIGIGIGVNTAFNDTFSAIKEDTIVTAVNGANAEAGMLLVEYKDDEGNDVEDTTHEFQAIAVSGAGAKTLGIAGSVGVNVVDNKHEAYIASDSVTSTAGEVGAKTENKSNHKTYAGATVSMQVGKAGKKATARAQGDTENVLAQDDAQAAIQQQTQQVEQLSQKPTITLV
jgi:hypothetical protein